MEAAADCGSVVVLVPSGQFAPSPFGSGTPAEIAAFPGATLAIFADDAALAAFGRNPLDPGCRIPSARAGREQGRREARRVAQVLGF
jgi:NTE family protein